MVEKGSVVLQRMPCAHVVVRAAAGSDGFVSDVVS